MIHLIDPKHVGFLICGKQTTDINKGDDLVHLGSPFTCEDCKKTLQSHLNKFTPAEWDMIASAAEKHGFKLTFEMSPTLDGSVFCSTVSPTIHLIGYRGDTAIAAALTVSKEITKMCRDTVRKILFLADCETFSGTRDAFQRAKEAMGEMERAIALHEELRAINEVAEGEKP